jgi:8-oxo-dGTP pyrophosphatase MutT (NUDIX family)
MPISPYLARLREQVGHQLLVVPSVTAAVLDDAGRLLLARHSNGGVWVAPGGSLEPDELPADAVIRETWEETGLLVEPVRLVGVYAGPEFRVRYANGDEVAYVMSVFACRLLGGTAQPDGVETLEVAYCSESEIATLATPAWLGVVLPDVLAAGGVARFAAPTWQPPRRA